MTSLGESEKQVTWQRGIAQAGRGITPHWRNPPARTFWPLPWDYFYLAWARKNLVASGAGG
jgi:hypothetical protein